MAHGGPDYGITRSRDVVYPVVDLSEHAIRLGAPVSFDRRGEVIFWDDFREGAAGWALVASGAGAASKVALDYAAARGYSLELTSGTDLSRYAKAEHQWGFHVLTKLGIEFKFSLYADVESLQVLLYVYDGTNLHHFEIMIYPGTGVAQYVDTVAAYQNFLAGLTFTKGKGYFHWLKLVVDLDTDLYTRFILDGVTTVMASYAGHVVASGLEPRALLRVRCDSAAAETGTVHLDEVIVTQNEP